MECIFTTNTDAEFVQDIVEEAAACSRTAKYETEYRSGEVLVFSCPKEYVGIFASQLAQHNIPFNVITMRRSYN